MPTRQWLVLCGALFLPVIVATPVGAGDRAHDLAAQAANQKVATCQNVTTLDACHQNFPTGCSASKAPRFDAYLNFLKNQDPSPTLMPIAVLSEQDWATKESLLADIDLQKGNHAQRAQQLADLGEGNIYSVVGYLYYRISNHGETSNCQLAGSSNNDFHIGLGFDSTFANQLLTASAAERQTLMPQAQEQSVIVEMTPQYRAHHHSAWTDVAVDALIGHQVKAVGQLVVDNEHADAKDDCGNGDGPQPGCWRASVWELHPVTEFYVCSSEPCAIDSADWKPLDQSPSLSEIVTRVRGELSRLVGNASDWSSISLQAWTDRSSKTVAVAPDLRAALAQLHVGDTVMATTTGGARPELRSVEIASVPVSGQRRVAALGLAGVILLGAVWLLHASPRRMVLGDDGRYSKSKFQVALWFSVVMSGYLAAIGLRWWASGWSLVGGVGIPTDLLVISGISAFTFVGAKQITTSKIAHSPAFAATKGAVVPSHFPDDLVNDDTGAPDLGDTQMVIITLIAVATYLVTMFAWLSLVPLTAQTQMPNVDSTLVAIFGLGQGAYLIKKQIAS